MKRIVLFAAFVVASRMYCMEEQQAKHQKSTNLSELLHEVSNQPFQIQWKGAFATLPEPVKIEILSRVPFLELMCICKLVCKEWRNKINEHYNSQLKLQETQLDRLFKKEVGPRAYNQLNWSTNHIYNENSHGTYEQTDVIAWKKNTMKKLMAGEHNLHIWLYNQLKHEAQNVDEKAVRIEQTFDYEFTINPLWNTVKHNAGDCFDLLLAVGEDVNKVNVLECAINCGRTAMAKKLILVGAEISYQRSLNFVDNSWERYDALTHATRHHNGELIAFIKEFKKNHKPVEAKKRKQPCFMETEELADDF